LETESGGRYGYQVTFFRFGVRDRQKEMKDKPPPFTELYMAHFALSDIAAKKFSAREDFLTGMAVVAKDKSLIVRSGDRKMTLTWNDLKDYRGQRAQRGSVLPRGWRSVDLLETE
jgi:predicted secreted hydrolase